MPSTDLVREIVYRMLKKELLKKTYLEHLLELTSSLTKVSSKVETVLREMAQVVEERETSAKELEEGLTDLEKREKELKEKIALLQSVLVPVVEHFARLVEPGEKRSARRDYFLYMAGVIVTTIIAIVLQIGLEK